MAKMAAMSPAFPEKRGRKRGSKKVATKTSVDPKIEGYTPKGAMRGGGSTTTRQSARMKRLANLKL